jgi:hypothetical protein
VYYSGVPLRSDLCVCFTLVPEVVYHSGVLLRSDLCVCRSICGRGGVSQRSSSPLCLLCLPFHLSQWCVRAEFFSASISLQVTIEYCWRPLYSSGAALRLEVLARLKFGRALTGACVDHVLLATVSTFVHRCCSIHCPAIVRPQLHPCLFDHGRSTAEAAAAAARCGSATGLTHRPNINDRAEDQSDYFVCSISVVVRHLHDDRAVPRFFASAVEPSPSVP